MNTKEFRQMHDRKYDAVTTDRKQAIEQQKLSVNKYRNHFGHKPAEPYAENPPVLKRSPRGPKGILFLRMVTRMGREFRLFLCRNTYSLCSTVLIFFR